MPPLHCRCRGFGFDFFGLLRGWLRYGDSRDLTMSLGQELGSRHEECDRAPLRSLYKPSASNPATAISTFWNPSASNFCASSLNKLAHHRKCCPWKIRKQSVIKATLSHKTMKEQSERLSNTKQREIPDSTTPAPHLLLRLAPLTSIHEWAQSTSYCSYIVTLASSPSDDSSVDETI